jgi:UDP-glucose 4-epimerase
MTVFVNGANGFLGSQICIALAKANINVVAIIRRNSSQFRFSDFCLYPTISICLWEDKEEWQNRFANSSSLVFIHSAWVGIDGKNRTGGSQFTENYFLLQSVLDFCKKNNVNHFIGVGSLTEHGNQSVPLAEDSAIAPVSSYARAKVAACWYTADWCASNSITWSWARVGPIYGNNDNPNWLIPYILEQAYTNNDILLSPGEQVWDYLHVADAATAFVNIAINAAAGIFNFGSGAAATIRNIAETIHRVTGSTSLLKFGHYPYSQNQMMRLEADNSKLLSTGWKPLINLEEGIRLMLPQSI